MPKKLPEIQSFARIKVIGAGGSGKSAINHMINSNLDGVDYIAMNTDTQDLHNCLAKKKIHLGKNITRGLGAGMDPNVGRKAAEETREEIQDAVKGADIVFIACGMGGGTATGAAPVIARCAREEGILTVAIVTKPFFFEGQKRTAIAEEGLTELEKEVDALIVVPNDRLLSVIDKNMTVRESFKMVDEVLHQAVDGIADIIKTAGVINLDFADIKRVLKDSGTAIIGIGSANGENRAVEAAKAAISSPLLDVSINGAKGLLYAIYGNENLAMSEVSEAAKIITESVDKDATIIFGIVNDDTLKNDEIKIVVIATKFPADYGIRSSRNNASYIRKSTPIFEEDVKIDNDEEYKDSSEKKTKHLKSKDNDNLIDNLSSILKNKKVDAAINEEEKSRNKKREELNNELDEEDILRSKKLKHKDITSNKEDDIFEDEEDWNMLPPFLRKKK